MGYRGRRGSHLKVQQSAANYHVGIEESIITKEVSNGFQSK